jgi:hypothetical protein
MAGRWTVLLLLFSSLCAAECIPFDQAKKHVGENQCITGKVLRVEAGARGVHYLDFCENYRLCPFSVVVFSYDLKNVGDVRQLAGRVVEINGEVKEYDGRAEIVLESSKQLDGSVTALPPLSPLSRNFDVEQRGRFSAGKFRPSHTRSRKKVARPRCQRKSPRTSNPIRTACVLHQSSPQLV